MIKIIHDRFGLIEADAAHLNFDSASAYISVRQRIHDALQYSSPIDVIIVVCGNRSVRLIQWLQDLRDYDNAHIEFSNYLPSMEINERYNIQIPVDSDEGMLADFLRHHLRPPTNVERDDPEGWIASHLVDAVLGTNKASERHLAELVMWASELPNLPSRYMGLIRRRIKRFELSDERYSVLASDNIHIIAKRMLLKQLLKSYPTTVLEQLNLLTVPTFELRKTIGKFTKLIKEPEVHNALQSFWIHHLKNTARPSMIEALRFMTGIAEPEITAIESLVKLLPGELTLTRYRQIQSKFTHAEDSIQARIKNLSDYVVVQQPTLPETCESWDTDTWVDWASREYLPYFLWVIRTKQPRNMQLEYGKRFGEWFVSHYKAMPWNNSTFFTLEKGQVFEHSSQAKLWLIVDSLSWWESQILVEIAVQAGLGIPRHEPHLCALPSLTSISKRALVQGSLNKSEKVEPHRNVLERDFVQRHISGKTYSQLQYLKDFVFESDSVEGLHVLFYNYLDSYHHDTPGFEERIIKGHLETLVDMIIAFFRQCRQQGLSCSAFISSDHGITLLPPEAQPLALPRLVSEVIDSDIESDPVSAPQKKTRTRVATINKLPLPIPDEWNKNWWVLDKDKFLLPYPFLIPKDYVPIGGKVNGWVHGGATPEEVIVPFIQLTATPIESLQTPQVHIHIPAEGIEPETSVEVAVTVSNPNGIMLREIVLILGDETSVQIEKIAPNETINPTVNLAPIYTRSTSYQMIWELTCQADGKLWSFEGSFSLTMLRLQGDDPLDTLLFG